MSGKLDSCVVTLWPWGALVYGPYTYQEANRVLIEVRRRHPGVESHRSPIRPW